MVVKLINQMHGSNFQSKKKKKKSMAQTECTEDIWVFSWMSVLVVRIFLSPFT